MGGWGFWAIAAATAFIGVLGLGALLLPPERGDYPLDDDDDNAWGV